MFLMYTDGERLPWRLDKWSDYILPYFDNYYWILLDLYEDNNILSELLDMLWKLGIDYLEVDEDEYFYEYMRIDPRDYMFDALCQQLEEFNELLHRY